MDDEVILVMGVMLQQQLVMMVELLNCLEELVNMLELLEHLEFEEDRIRG